MRAKLEKLAVEPQKQSFIGYTVRVPTFELYWHFHPEYELTLIVKGRGNRLVGDSLLPFSAGDLVLLGPNLPHVWVSDEYEAGECEAMVFQFTTSFVQNLLPFPEFFSLKALFKNAAWGLKFMPASQNEKETLQNLMANIIAKPSLPGFLTLLSVLATINAEPLSSPSAKPGKTNDNTTRMNSVLNFIQANYLQPIALKDAANAVNLSESAFSKFFLRNLGKTFTTYLLDLRISHACILLLETDHPVSLIAHYSGFENLSYFNRVFLEKKGMQPGKFRKISSGSESR